MEELKKDKKYEYTQDNESIQILKTFIYSFIGIMIFFIPIKLDGQIKTLIYHMADKLQYEIRPFIQLCIVAYLILGSIHSLLNIKKETGIKKIFLFLQCLSILIIINIFYGSEYAIFVNTNTALLMESIILDLSTLLPLSAIFMPFILEYGLLDIVESYFHRPMKKLFNLSGKTVVNILMYILVDCFCGFFMTNKLYTKGKIRNSEACILILNFSLMSFPMIIYTANELSINKLDFIIINIVILVLSNIVLCRIYPLSKKKKSYYIKTGYKETVHKKNKMQKAIDKYLQNKEDKSIFRYIIDNLEEVIRINMYLVPNIVLILFIGDIILNRSVLDIIDKLLYPAVSLLKLPDINHLSDVLVYSFYNDILAIELVDKNIDYATRLLIGIIVALKSISISSSILYISNTNINISKKEFFIVYIERIIAIMFIYSLIYYFYIGYIM